MNCGNKRVLRIHWTFESGRDYGRGMPCILSIHQGLLREVEGTVRGEHSSALSAGRIFDTPPLGRALQSVFSALGLLLDLKGFEKCAALSGAAGFTPKEDAGLSNPCNENCRRNHNCRV